MWKFWEQIGTMKIITNVFFCFLFFVSSLISEENGKGNQTKLYRKDDMFAMKTTQARKFLFSA